VNVQLFGCGFFLLALFSMSSFILNTLAEAPALTNPIRDEMTKLSLCKSAQHFITGWLSVRTMLFFILTTILL
jgi:hypothetical protein